MGHSHGAYLYGKQQDWEENVEIDSDCVTAVNMVADGSSENSAYRNILKNVMH